VSAETQTQNPAQRWQPFALPFTICKLRTTNELGTLHKNTVRRLLGAVNHWPMFGWPARTVQVVAVSVSVKITYSDFRGEQWHDVLMGVTFSRACEPYAAMGTYREEDMSDIVGAGAYLKGKW